MTLRLADVTDVSRVFRRFRLQNGRNFQKPTSADHVSPLFHLKKDTVSVSETLWVLSLIQWTVGIFIMKLIKTMGPATDQYGG